MHNLDFSKGFAAVAYRGEKPWHQYGFEMLGDETIEQWQVRAGLDFEVERRGINFETPGHGDTSIPSMRALVRSDDDSVLSVVGKNYKVVQPGEVLEFFRDLVSDHGFTIETAGALAGGRKIWALAKTGKDFTIPGTTDEILGYLLLCTSYDKTFATTGQYTGIRVVCDNTLTWSLQQTDNVRSGSGAVFRVPHNQKLVPSEVKANLGILDSSWGDFTSTIRQLAQTPVSKEQAVRYFMEIMGYSEEEPQYAVDNIYTIKKLLQSYETAPGQQLESAKDTAWGLVNAVTYFTDHTRRATDNGTRINSAWFGQSASLKRRALRTAVDLTQKEAA